jgi:hypothetical protein
MTQKNFLQGLAYNNFFSYHDFQFQQLQKIHYIDILEPLKLKYNLFNTKFNPKMTSFFRASGYRGRPIDREEEQGARPRGPQHQEGWKDARVGRRVQLL